MQPDFNSGNIKVIIGLGNPGNEYAGTYHNAGRMFVDWLEINSSLPKEKLLKSETFMNESGSYVARLVKKWKIAAPEETLVVHDDSDLPLGDYKLSFGSGSAGHKGVESVIKALGTKDFWRLRIGVRPVQPTGPSEKKRRKKAGLPRRVKAGEFVLRKISGKNKRTLEETFEKILSQFNLT